MRVKVGIVEDQRLFREGIKALLLNQGFEVVLEAADGFSFVEQLNQAECLPEVILVDLALPEVNGKSLNGLDITHWLKDEFPELKIIVLSVHADVRHMAQLISAGANAYLAKDVDPFELIQAITDCHQKGCYFNNAMLQAVQFGMNHRARESKQLALPIELTKREKEVLELICQQYTAPEIAEKLFISSRTVDGHRNNLIQKTGARNTAGLVVYALQNQLVSLDF